jgi:hypothetical protein
MSMPPLRVLVIIGCVLLAASMLVPWANGYGPGAPGVLFPLQRPVVPGLLDSLYLILAAIALGVVSLLNRGRTAALLGGFVLAAFAWVWLLVFLVDPSALGGQALPASGFIPALGFWLAGAGVAAFAAAIVLGVTPRWRSLGA